MSLIELKQVSKSFVGETLFSDVSFRLQKNQKMALIGNNGTGKTTLLKMIIGEETPDNGEIIVSKQMSIGYLSQALLTSLHHPLFKEMEDVFTPLKHLEERLHRAGDRLSMDPLNEKWLKDYGELEHQFEEKGGYLYRSKIESILGKFGFNKNDYERHISSFSGGERSRIAFCKILLMQPDILLLDEPTNHLDIETIEWLESYLKDYPGSILLVSHDRFFIDVICDHIVEIEFKEVETYSGNYTFYLEEKAVRFQQRMIRYQLQQKEMDHLRQLIERFKPKPTKVRLARDREKKLVKLQQKAIINPERNQRKTYFDIKGEEGPRKLQMTIDEVGIGYEKELVHPFSIDVYSGDKIAILGANGTGKSTLLKYIAQQLEPFCGKITHHRTLKIGYFDQHQIEITGSQSLFGYFHDLYPHLTHFEVRHQLGAFLFSQDEVEKPLSILSGGEKMRLAFAILLMKKYDVLLLDEPTNHLDMTTKKILEGALDEYPGTVIFVSHDRYFVDEIATDIGIIQNSQMTFFHGNYSEYRLNLESKNYLEKDNEVGKQKENKIEKTKAIYKKQRPKEIIELEIVDKEKEISSFEESINSEEVYTDYVALREFEEKLEAAEEQLRVLENEYFEAVENENANK